MTFDQIGACALSTRETLRATYGIAKMLIEERIPGDFVECGVFAGSQAAAMAMAIMDSQDDSGRTINPVRRIHLFDSFAGIPQAGPEDGDIRSLVGGANGDLVSSGISVCSIDAVRENMRRWSVPDSLLVYHPGWFQDTVPAANILQIALLRLDGDLYESTRVCLEHLYPRVVRGGWCIADDYGLGGCRKAVNPHLAMAPIYWRHE